MFNFKDIRPELEAMGFRNLGALFWNANTAQLYEEVVRRREGIIAHMGPIVVRTGHHLGRSPEDRFIVKEPSSMDKIAWGKVNRGIEEKMFLNLYYRLQAYFQNKDMFIQDCYVGADPQFRIPVRIITERAWNNLFSRNMFIQMRKKEEIPNHSPEFTVIAVPKFHAIPEIDTTRTESFILLHMKKKLILIGGTSYAGEIKKSIFTMLNYVYPQQSVLSMHCSCNVGERNDSALFFGLSGTGKTSLSADPNRKLIGDDEHGWSQNGIFNFEGGCYAKVIKLSPEAEPQIYQCTRKFGTILENVAVNQNSRRIDLDDDSLTENTRACYPISHIPNALRSGMCAHPENVIMLTCDAFGVMPPIAKLTDEQAVFHFLSGYTAKVAGTELGVKEPQTTFSTCFGAPFMALQATVYARLFMEKIKKHKVKCWLLNTGWVGKPYGEGERIKIAYSRALVNAILDGSLNHDQIEYRTDPRFGFLVPESCPGVPPEVLRYEELADGKQYEARAKRLAEGFRQNFEQFRDETPKEVMDAIPRVE